MTTNETQPATTTATLPWRRRHKSIAAVGVVLIAGLAIGGHYFFRSPAGIAAVRPNRWPGSDPAIRTPDKLRVLFVGNSFTQYNGGLALVMNQLAASAGKTPAPVFDQYTVWGQTWQHLWQNYQAPEAIAEGHWDFVVLQDYSIAAMIYRDEMDEYGRIFSDAIREAGAQPVLFMTWARGGEEPTQQMITEAYTDVGADNNATVAPVGLAFERVRNERPDLVIIHEDDKKHPTEAGTYLIGCVFYAVFYHQAPVGLTPRIGDGTKTWIDLPPETARYLQQVAWDTVTQFRSKPAVITKLAGGRQGGA
jgi:hypothetical protein